MAAISSIVPHASTRKFSARCERSCVSLRCTCLRSGDLDPGALIYLMDHQGYAPREIERLVNHESGLIGVSGLSGDMQTLLSVQSTNPQAALAIEMFCDSVRQQIGAFAAVLGGLDRLIFTAGIGERAAPCLR